MFFATGAAYVLKALRRKFARPRIAPALLERVEPPLEDVQVGVDWGRGESWTLYRCECGWETGEVHAMVGHLRAHGATRCVFTPVVAECPECGDPLRGSFPTCARCQLVAALKGTDARR